MRVLFLPISALLLLGSLSSEAQGTKRSGRSCFVTGDALADQSAPRFEQYPVESSPPFSPAKLDLQSNPVARRYRTVIREEMTHGPNFAGHYRVVFWGCGTSCSQFAVVNLKTGHVVTLKSLYSVAYADFITEDFMPNTDSEGYGFRFKRNSNLLVLVGTLVANHSREGRIEEGASYYVLRNEMLRLVHRTSVAQRTCENK